MISIYLYYYDNYSYIVSYLNEHNFKKNYSSKIYNKYKFDVLSEKIDVIVYKEINIVALQCSNKNMKSQLKEFTLLKKVDLLDKDLFIKLFENNFSHNLCDISLNINILGSEDELVQYQGYKLLEQNILEQFDFFDSNSSIKLRAYSLQPKGYRYALKFCAVNRLEFNSKYNLNQIESILTNLIILIRVS